jgi:hypothetical protein
VLAKEKLSSKRKSLLGDCGVYFTSKIGPNRRWKEEFTSERKSLAGRGKVQIWKKEFNSGKTCLSV